MMNHLQVFQHANYNEFYYLQATKSLLLQKIKDQLFFKGF